MRYFVTLVYNYVIVITALYLFPIILESLPLRFLISARKVEIPKSYPARYRIRRRTIESITS
jgi:hypothetical protein